MRHDIISPLKDDLFCGFLNKLWNDGWLDSYSDNHFLIRAMNNNIDSFAGRTQLEANNANLFNYGKKIGYNFAVNFSNKLSHLYNVFGEDEIRKFVIDQLSAGKDNYDEDQFFRALSEVEVLQFYSTFVYSANKICRYEPSLGENGRNPEARFIYDEKITVDIEMKTPGFSNDNKREKMLLPTVLINENGRKTIHELCSLHDYECKLPRARKIVDFINSASSKFEAPTSANHLNLLYINWSYSEFPSRGYLEAYSILYNDLTGFINHKEIGLKFGIKEEAYTNISAIIVYTSSLNNLITQDFRYLWSTRNFAIVPLNVDITLLAKITQMNYHNNKFPPYLLSTSNARSYDEQIEEAVLSTKVIQILKKDFIK